MKSRSWAAPIFALLFAGGLGSSAQGISSLSPNPAPQGSTLSIVGTGFGSANANSYVNVNGATVSYATWSNTLITVPVPTN